MENKLTPKGTSPKYPHNGPLPQVQATYNQSKPISLQLEFEDKQIQIYTDTNTYYSLMELITTHIVIPGFGICSGMGSCGTCMVDICEKNGGAPKYIFSCSERISYELANTIIKIHTSFY